MIIDGVYWFTNPKGSYGIVFGKDRYNGRPKMYIGPAIKGDPELDKKYIAEWGAKISYGTIRSLHEYYKSNGEAKG